MNPAFGLLFERIEWMDDLVPRAAALNMAVDEALLHGIAETPILRIYRWVRPAVSIGCFEPMAPVQSEYPERELVRRWTGGGVVEHGLDLTYSLLVPRATPLPTMRANESYRLIHAAVAQALARAGITNAALESSDAQNPSVSRSCFEKPVPYDVLANGRKVAGAAQRRTRHGLLHQGSIFFALPAGTSAPGSALHHKLARELAAGFGSRIEPRILREAEQAAAETWVLTKYGAAQWTRKF